MISGHGDDAYKYNNIRMDFSSNICAHGSHEALMAHLASQPDLLDHYPEPEAWSLERLIAEHHDIDPACVIVTSGATEAIYLIAHTFRYRPVIPQPTFSEYEDACKMAGVEEGGREVLWLCNPNNPTGEVYDQLYIDRKMAEYDLVVLDQSYEGYTDAHVMTPRWGCRTTYSIQIHSMTKMYGVPGLRLGYITAHERLTEQLRRYLRPWSVSALAVEAGKYLLQHDDLLCRPDLAEAQRLRNALLQLPGITVAPTQTNFMLCCLSNGTAAELKEFLASQHGILIRDASNFLGLTPRHFRIAAQTPAANDALITAISHYTRLHER
jgi:threonine-phosphate decarboxylase